MRRDISSGSRKALDAVVEGEGGLQIGRFNQCTQRFGALMIWFPGKRRIVLFPISAITPENKWFDLKGVEKEKADIQSQPYLFQGWYKITRKIHH